jgi:hypothetical protein
MHDLEFREQLRAAQRQAEVAPLQSLRSHANKNWRAAAWLLERTMPHDYGRRQPDSVPPDLAIQLMSETVRAIIAEVPEGELKKRLRRRFEQQRVWLEKELQAAADLLHNGKRRPSGQQAPLPRLVDHDVAADAWAATDAADESGFKSSAPGRLSENSRPLTLGTPPRGASNNPENSRPSAGDYASEAAEQHRDPDTDTDDGQPGPTSGSARSTIRATSWARATDHWPEGQQKSATFVVDKTAPAATSVSENGPQRDPPLKSFDAPRPTPL